MNLYALIIATTMVVGCSSNDDVSLQENTTNSIDSILDKTWNLTTVQNNSGDQIPVVQEIGFEFTIRLSSSFVPPGGDVVQEVMAVGGIDVCNNYGGGYTLENGLLNLISVSEDSQACNRANEEPSRVFSSVLFTTDNAAMASLEDDRLAIASGNNEKLIFTAGGSAEFIEFHNGDLAFTEDLTFNQPRFQVIKTAEELSSLYTEALIHPSCTDCELEALNTIDFSKSIVLFVAHEIVESGGYSIKIEDIYDAGARLKVDVVKTTPGDNCVVTDAFTGPYKLYKLTGSFDHIDFVEFVVQDAAC